MNPLKVAIIGHGRSGRNIHAQSLEKMKEYFYIAAVADQSEERRLMAERDFGCETVADYRELFGRKDLDLIVNASPSHQHVPISLEFLEQGFHVLCEKPLARKVEDVDRLMAAAKASGKTLAVFQQSRFNPAFVQVRNVIASGVLGRIVQARVAYNGFARRWDWQTLKSMNGGNLLNTGPHPVDQALQLFGTDVTPEVWCRMDQANSFGDAEDYVKLILHGPGKPLVDVEISSCDAYAKDHYVIQGTHGGLRGDFHHLEWTYFRPEESPQQQLEEQPLSTKEGNPAYCSEELTWYKESWDIPENVKDNLFFEMTRTYYEMLYRTISEGQPLEVTMDEIRTQVAVMEQCFAQNPKFQ
ncbi:Gfo/Idh/MocA family protein [Marinicrinis lubricantis]|uniref:Gfo/Idh/MocA family protein n=1 Tax=Marinicrinis lubricantis TaxID=2086470 RepID=A0ABW1IK79_9BACL